MNSLSVMKDGSPASTCSSSPKLDWMIKRGMVGLFLKTCPGFSSVHLSTTSVSLFCLVGLFYFTFALVWIDFVWIHFWCSVFEVLCYNTLVCMICFFFYMWRRWIVFFGSLLLCLRPQPRHDAVWAALSWYAALFSKLSYFVVHLLSFSFFGGSVVWDVLLHFHKA